MTAWTRQIVPVAMGVSAALASFTGVRTLVEARGPREVVLETPEDLRLAEWQGFELVLVLVTSASCEPSKDPLLEAVLERAAEALTQHATARGIGFTTVGVADDASVSLGVDHLQRLASFDELSVGRGKLNSMLLRYVYDEMPGPAQTPQLVLTLRSTVSPEVDAEASTLRRLSERVVLRKPGLAAISQWAENGFPVPDLHLGES